MEPTDGADTSDPLAGLALPPDVYIYPPGDRLPGMDEQIVEVTGCTLETAKWAIEAAGAGRGLLERAVDLVLTVSRSDSTEKYKVVCLVRQDLGMGPGKVAAQVAHGVLGAVRESNRREPGQARVRAWEDDGEPTIVLAVRDLEHMESLIAQANAKMLAVHTVSDAGRTEVAPGSQTVTCIGPDLVASIDDVTGGLSLL